MERSEAIEIVREYYPSSGKDLNEALETLIPELKESEDERIRKELIRIFKSLGDGKIPVDINYADIFAWLEKQGSQNLANSAKTCKDEQNPAWSEEDEERQKAIIGILDYQASKTKDRICATDGFLLDDLIDWLKSLKEKYTWKPSEQQMDALDNFIYAVNPDTKKYGKIIISLYDDLKKLKE